MTAAADERFMRRCLELAARGAGTVSPNPMVGCVIVGRAGDVVGEGYHRRLGGPHAEANALAAAGARARGATMYVSLEPCRHRSNRRTVPCAPAVLEAGIRRLVVGAGDPIRGHAGGARWLKQQGVRVETGVLRGECIEANRFFFTWARHQRPWFTLKAAATLDGRVATHTGKSQWITGPLARKDGHRLRATLDAILVGVETVRADDPRLTARGVPGRDPMRIVIDSRLRTPPGAALLPARSRSRARVVIASTEAAPAAKQRRLEAAGAEVWRLGRGERVDLNALAQRLGAEDVTSVLVEGGGRTHRGFVDAGLADEVLLYLAPIALGGQGTGVGPGWLGGVGAAELGLASRFRFSGVPRLLGTDLALTLRPRR